MSEKHSVASKNRWAKIPKEKRSQIMRNLALSKIKKMSKEELSNHGKYMSNIKKGLIAMLIVFPVLSFGLVVKDIKSYDFMGQIITNRGNNVLVYKVVDPVDPKVACYVSVHEFGQSGATSAISCVK